ncbi:MAG: sensor histidine kinase KdpD [Myxococcaceae bacterium]
MPSPAARDDRPDPDALLRRVMGDERARSRLKIFFGFAPGVGKTFAMLESARRLESSGVDVVVGLVETHGRQDTAALLDGLEVLPRKTLSYRGHELQEFDLERALARRPAVLLLDELAHTNVEGSRHPRRWQDVLELLDSGIEVHTTLNVQHVESLNDVVAQITGVPVRETVPDALIDRADGIELVDLPPEELLKRLEEGKVYVPEQARRATENFFRQGNLLALRELALRRTAERVDVQVRAWRALHEIDATWPTTERIMVCIGPAPASARLVRAARRIAAGLRAPWYAVWVSNPLTPLAPDDQERLETHLRLVESLGGETVRLTGTPVADELLRWAREHNITRLLLGKPTHTWWRDRLRGSLLDAVVRGSGDVDVLVISGDDEEARPARTAQPATVEGAQKWLGAAGAFALTTALAVGAEHLLHVPDPEILFFAGIIAIAAWFGRGPAIAAAALSVAAYDFFCVPPFLTFAVSDTRFVLTFAMMFGVGVGTSGLVSRLRQQEQAAREREADTRALLTLTRDLAQASQLEALARAICTHVGAHLGGTATLLLVTPGGVRAFGGPAVSLSEQGVVLWAHEHQREAGHGTETLSGSEVLALPVGRTGGVLAWRSTGTLDGSRRALLDAFVRQAAVALERLQFSEAAEHAALRARTEELRSSLLSTVSHDLRTPLAVVTGAATTLRDGARGLDEPTRAQLLDTIVDEAERLERLVRNLLDMTRVQSGSLHVTKEWVPVDEVVGSARARVRPAPEVRLSGTPEVSLLHVDPVLFEQVLWNLLDNAAKHAPGSAIDLEVARDGSDVRLTVSDRGPGITVEEAERLFEKFYRADKTVAPGAGLGLAICRGIVEAHGGRIEARPRDGGGASFVVRVPLDGPPPAVPSEAA